VTVAAVTGQSGNYAASFTPTATGHWRLALSCTHSGYTYRWTEEVEVVTAAQADPAGALSGGSRTLVILTDEINPETGYRQVEIVR
jgi:ABC-type uncharacterized transport system ATPase subunit